MRLLHLNSLKVRPHSGRDVGGAVYDRGHTEAPPPSPRCEAEPLIYDTATILPKLKHHRSSLQSFTDADLVGRGALKTIWEEHDRLKIKRYIQIDYTAFKTLYT